MPAAFGNPITPLGLEFVYDTGDITSFKGAPTTNIGFNANNSLNSSGNWWNNSGAADFNDNDTSLEKPIIPNVNTAGLRIFSARTTTAGNQHIGSAHLPVSAGTQYSFSIYFYFTGTSMQAQPYVRGSVGNYPIVYFDYKGDTNYLNWPRRQWILIKATFTAPSGETGVYMSSYIGDQVGEKAAYFGYQLEAKSSPTPLVLGTRSTSQALQDVIQDRVINTPTAGYSGNTLAFDGTSFSNHPNLGGDWVVKTGGGWTMEHIVYYNSVPGGYNNTTSPACFFGSDTISYNSWYWSVLNNKLALWNISPGYWRYGSTTLQSGRYYHIAITCNHVGTRYQFYLNGVAEGGDHQTQEWSSGYSGLRVNTIGAGNSANRRTLNGQQPVTKIYSRTLTPQEIYSSYLGYKTRFNL